MQGFVNGATHRSSLSNAAANGSSNANSSNQSMAAVGTTSGGDGSKRDQVNSRHNNSNQGESHAGGGSRRRLRVGHDLHREPPEPPGGDSPKTVVSAVVPSSRIWALESAPASAPVMGADRAVLTAAAFAGVTAPPILIAEQNLSLGTSNSSQRHPRQQRPSFFTYRMEATFRLSAASTASITGSSLNVVGSGGRENSGVPLGRRTVSNSAEAGSCFRSLLKELFDADSSLQLMPWREVDEQSVAFIVSPDDLPDDDLNLWVVSLSIGGDNRLRGNLRVRSSLSYEQLKRTIMPWLSLHEHGLRSISSPAAAGARAPSSGNSTIGGVANSATSEVATMGGGAATEGAQSVLGGDDPFGYAGGGPVAIGWMLYSSPDITRRDAVARYLMELLVPYLQQTEDDQDIDSSMYSNPLVNCITRTVTSGSRQSRGDAGEGASYNHNQDDDSERIRTRALVVRCSPHNAKRFTRAFMSESTHRDSIFSKLSSPYDKQRFIPFNPKFHRLSSDEYRMVVASQESYLDSIMREPVKGIRSLEAKLPDGKSFAEWLLTQPVPAGDGTRKSSRSTDSNNTLSSSARRLLDARPNLDHIFASVDRTSDSTKIFVSYYGENAQEASEFLAGMTSKIMREFGRDVFAEIFSTDPVNEVEFMDTVIRDLEKDLRAITDYDDDEMVHSADYEDEILPTDKDREQKGENRTTGVHDQHRHNPTSNRHKKNSSTAPTANNRGSAEARRPADKPSQPPAGTPLESNNTSNRDSRLPTSIATRQSRVDKSSSHEQRLAARSGDVDNQNDDGMSALSSRTGGNRLNKNSTLGRMIDDLMQDEIQKVKQGMAQQIEEMVAARTKTLGIEISSHLAKVTKQVASLRTSLSDTQTKLEALETGLLELSEVLSPITTVPNQTTHEHQE